MAWLDKEAHHAEAVSRYSMVKPQFEAVQLDEFWGFVKKEGQYTCTPLERLAQLYGDRWIWLSFDPVHKIVSAFVAGKINRANADRLLQQTKAVNNESLHIFFQ